MTDITFENVDRERLDSIYSIVAPYSQMWTNERYFLNGIVRYLKPQKVLEVGVAQGGGSSIILNAISDIECARLFSVDYLEKYPPKGGRITGFVVEDNFPDLKAKWKIYRGGDISRFIEEIGDGIDLMMLDTAHIHPWETLNFLCAFPFLKKGRAWVVLHDIYEHYSKSSCRDELACRYLWGHVVSDEKVSPEADYPNLFSNIGAFHVTEDTEKYIGNLFESLLIPWGVRVPSSDIEEIKLIIRKYYPDRYYSQFLKILDAQDFMFKHPQTLTIDIDELKKLPILIFGTGSGGRAAEAFLKSVSIDVDAFCDSKKYYQPGKSVNGKPVYDYENLPENLQQCNFVIAASGEGVDEIVVSLKKKFGAEHVFPFEYWGQAKLRLTV